MMKKLKSNWQAIALTVVVLLSLFISWIVWTNPFPFEGARHENFNNKQSQQYTPQSMEMFIFQLKQLRQMKKELRINFIALKLI